MTVPLHLRAAEPADAPAIAALHAASWRSAYRGILTDTYLDGPVAADRMAAWRDRMAYPEAGQIVLLAKAGPTLAGFVCAFADRDPGWGSLIDNLHAAPGTGGRGVGRALLGGIAERLAAAPIRPVHLFCLEANAAARRFYDRAGGAAAGCEAKREPDGSVRRVIRFVWSSPAALAAGVA